MMESKFSQCLPIFTLVIFLAQHCTSNASSEVDCCTEEYSLVDCTAANGVTVDGSVFLCYDISALSSNCMMSGWLYNENAVEQDGITCSSACGNIGSCIDDWAWASIVSMFFVSGFFMICSVICIKSERRRKRKGMTLAQAYRLPLGVPVIPTSSNRAVPRPRRTRMYSSVNEFTDTHGNDYSSGGDRSADEHVALLDDEDIQYGTSHDDTLPVAKLADDDHSSAYTHAYRNAYPQATYTPPGSPPDRWGATLFRFFRGRSYRHNSDSASSNEGDRNAENSNPYVEI